MKDYKSKVEYGTPVMAIAYDPSMAEMPVGVKARMTSRGAEAMVQRPDGIVFHAAPGDFFVQLPDQPLIVLNAPCFHALFELNTSS